MSSRKNRKAVREVNRILVTCFMGRVFGRPISKEYLRERSLYEKTEYYEIRKSLMERGFIKERGKYIEITEEGIKEVSLRLLGERKEELRWEEVYDAMRKHMPIFEKPVVMMKDRDRDNLFKLLLLMYPDSRGNGPEEYYKDLLTRLSRDFASPEYKNRLGTRFYHAMKSIGALPREAGEDSSLHMIGRTFFEMLFAFTNLDELKEIILAYYALDFKGYSRFFLPIIRIVKRIGRKRSLTGSLIILGSAVIGLLSEPPSLAVTLKLMWLLLMIGLFIIGLSAMIIAYFCCFKLERKLGRS